MMGILLKLIFSAVVLLFLASPGIKAGANISLNSNNASNVRASVPSDANKILETKSPKTNEELLAPKRRQPAKNMPSAGNVESAAVSPLKVMTYNIHHCKGMGGEISIERIADVIRRSGADIVGLQEVDRYFFRSNFQHQVKQIASKLGYNFAFGANLGIAPFGFGNAVVSRYPIISDRNIALPGKLEPRGALKATVRLKTGFDLAFITTHLGLSTSDREQQVNAIIDSLKGMYKGVIIAGDFNARIESLEFSKLHEFFNDSYQQVSPKNEGSTFGKHRIDFIWLSPDLKAISYSTMSSDASDHLPVIVEVRPVN